MPFSIIIHKSVVEVVFNCQNCIEVTEVGGVVLNTLPDDEVHTDADVPTQQQ